MPYINVFVGHDVYITFPMCALYQYSNSKYIWTYEASATHGPTTFIDRYTCMHTPIHIET